MEIKRIENVWEGQKQRDAREEVERKTERRDDGYLKKKVAKVTKTKQQWR